MRKRRNETKRTRKDAESNRYRYGYGYEYGYGYGYMVRRPDRGGHWQAWSDRCVALNTTRVSMEVWNTTQVKKMKASKQSIKQVDRQASDSHVRTPTPDLPSSSLKMVNQYSDWVRCCHCYCYCYRPQHRFLNHCLNYCLNCSSRGCTLQAAAFEYLIGHLRKNMVWLRCAPLVA